MNIDKTRKVVSIILMLLMIGTMVFNAFSMVGHCASSSSPITNSQLPLRVGAGWGNQFTQSEIDTIVNLCLQDQQNINDVDLWQVGAIVLSEKDDSSQKYRFNIYALPGFSVSSPSDFWSSSGSDFTWSNGNNYGGCRQLILNYDFTVDSFWWKSSGAMTINSSSFLTALPDNNFGVFSNQWFTGYPIYVISDISYNDVVYFTSDPLSVTGGHSKGGDITEYTYDPADTTEPADPSAVAGSGGWLSKILDSLNKIKNGIVYGFQNITDNLQSFFNQIYGGIEDQLNQIIDKLGGESLDTSDTSLSDVFLSTFEGSKIYGAYSVFSQGSVIVQGLFNSVETPETLRFEFDLPTMYLGIQSQGGSSNPSYITKPYGNKLVIDFDWYENVRNIVVPFVVAWLYVGFLIWLLRAIPGFISGSPSFNTRSASDGSPKINGHYEVYEFDDWTAQHHKKPMFRL